MSSSLTVQQAADFSGASYDNNELENGSIVDGYMLVYQKHDTSSGFTGQASVGWVSAALPIAFCNTINII